MTFPCEGKLTPTHLFASKDVMGSVSVETILGAHFDASPNPASTRESY